MFWLVAVCTSHSMNGLVGATLLCPLAEFLERWTECTAQEAQDATVKLNELGVSTPRRLAFFPASRLEALVDVTGQVRPCTQSDRSLSPPS